MIWEVGLPQFLLVTVALGGGTAYLTGRAVALTWLSPWFLLAYIALLSFAVRFIHFALFDGSLISPWYHLVDFVVLLAIGWLGARFTRTQQMAGQYSFEFAKASPLSWRRHR